MFFRKSIFLAAVFTLFLITKGSERWEEPEGYIEDDDQVCTDGFKTRILLTSNSDGELTAYEVEKDKEDSNQHRLRRKWRQMTICSRENTEKL